MDDISGRTIKGYELHELIGQGGFGAVYRAYQPLIGREVAIKIILPQHANRPDFIRRFESEAQLVARLEHPFIVPLYDYWREPGGAYLVMRWLKGGSLQDLIEKEGALDIARVSRLLTQIGEALAVAHRQGIIHRDLKLENILLDENGNAYLTDFGIAKDLGGKDRITQNDAILGSPAYLSPEQIKGEQLTPKTDIYAIGIVLYELLSGGSPYPDALPAALLYKHLSEPLPDISEVRPDLPPALNSVIQRATAKHPDDRYADILAMVTDFRHMVKYEVDGSTLGTRTIITSTGIAMPAPENPYKGLRAFQQADTADFFGRESLTQSLIGMLNETGEFARFLAVVGPSGSGKSSVVKAGVLPALRRGALPGSEDWFVVEMVPSTDPMEELEAALLRIAVNPPQSLLAQLNEDERGLLRAIKRVLPEDDTELVILIDQFEELFTLVDEESRRAHFLNNLLSIIKDPRSRVRLIITLRADFYDRPLNYVDFGNLVRQRTAVVLPLSPDELESAITGPATRVGMMLEPGLVTNIVTDVNEQPGALPLLQYALTELFERREANVLTQKAYEDIGGTLGALARRADELYDGLGDDGQESTRQLFLRLVTLGEGTEDTRRRVLQSELLSIGQDTDLMSSIIDSFGRYRLLTFDHDPATRSSTVEVAHEALIRQWSRLREWLAASREDLRLQRRLTTATEEWLASNKDTSFLARGARLSQLEEWHATTSLALNVDETAYLNASIAEREKLLAAEKARQQREATLEKRSRDRLRALVAVMTVAAMIAIGLAIVAFNQRQIAQDARLQAEANADEVRSLALAANARNALIEHNSTLSLALAIEANAAYAPAPVEVIRVLAEAAYGPGILHRMTGHTASVLNSDLSPDRQFTISASADGTVRLWDNATGAEIRRFEVPDTIITSAVFSPDGAQILASAMDGALYLWDAETGEQIRRIDAHEGGVTSAVFSVDGARILSGGLDRILRLWDASTGQDIQSYEGHVGVILDVDLSPDGRYAASSAADEFLESNPNDIVDRTVRIWDVETGEQLFTFSPPPGYVRTVAFSPDSARVISATWTGGTGGTISVWDLERGELEQQLFGHTDIVTGLAFTPDGRYILSSSWDRTLRVWDRRTGLEVNRFESFDDRLLNVSISADGDYAVVTSGNIGGDNIEIRFERSQDTSVWLIDLRSRAEVRRFTGSEDWIWSMDISGDGQYAVSGSGPLRGDPRDTSVRLWDISTGEVIRRFDGHTLTVEGVSFSPDGSTIVSTAWDGQVILWDAETGEEIRRFGDGERAHEGRGIMAVFSPNGQYVASGASGGEIILWDTNTGEAIRRFDGHENDVNDLEFSPDGRFLASGSADATVRLWDVATGQEARRFGENGISHDNTVNDVRFNADGTLLLSSSWDATARLWDVATGQEIQRFQGHNGPVYGVDFSEDGEVIITGSSDTTVRLWDVATGQELRRFTGHTDWVSEVRFLPGGRFALSSAQDNTMRLWQVARSSAELIEWAQNNRYVRGLSCAERTQFRVEPLCDE